jgi:hypothetical protein
MSTNDLTTKEQLHRGNFADGQANSDTHPDQRHVGTFADGEAHPEAYPGEDHLGTFAEGQAQPNAHAGEDHEGTFAEGSATVTTETPSIDYTCIRCGARRTLLTRPARGAPRRGRGESGTARNPVNRFEVLSVRRQPDVPTRARQCA